MPSLPTTSESALQEADRLMERRGFELRQVTWGYQALFRRTIAHLLEGGLLGPENEHVSRAFFEALQHADKSGFDMVLKSYLEALSGPYRWVMRLPRLFERWSRMGLRLAGERFFLGARFFEYSGGGELGRSPEELEFALDLIDSLLERQPQLVAPLMEGYSQLRDRLEPPGVRQYVSHALTLQGRNPESARRFLAGELETSRIYRDRLSRKAALSERQGRLERLARALCGEEVSVENLGRLDSDDLQERGSVFVCCRCAIYLPEQISELPDRAGNEDAFKTMVACACAAHLAGGFATVHGSGGLETCCELFDEGGRQNRTLCGLFYLAELYRTVQFCREKLPGLAPALRSLMELEFEQEPPRTPEDVLLARLLELRESAPPRLGRLASALRRLAGESDDFQTTLRLLAGGHGGDARALAEGMELGLPRAVSFFPDALFPLTIGTATSDQVRADLHDAAPVPPEKSEGDRREEEARAVEARQAGTDGTAPKEAEEEEPDSTSRTGYFYDEWNAQCGDYMRQWCCLHEIRPKGEGREHRIPDSVHRYAEQVRRVFEQLKPEESRTEKRLLEGDSIHLDHLVEYLAQGKHRQSSERRFYNKPLLQERDLAVAILLDVSGSTAEDCEAKRPPPGKGTPDPAGPLDEEEGPPTVLDVEKEAAFVLATGLSELGDTFGLFGFTGNGRENCLFYTFKEFEEAWGRERLHGLLSAHPGSATRIGVALRHAGWKLTRCDARTRLLLLITDGKPCDQDYDTESHYAQHDIRKACQENAREGIHTFCVSTSENSPGEMELMFPRGHYVILEDIRKLPSVLSRLYLRLTR